jgi:hypothetical protein
MAYKQIPFAILIPKHDKAKERLQYHGSKWIIKQISSEAEFHSGEGPWVIVMSIDGKKFMTVNALRDKDFKFAIGKDEQ